jgi:hypothetical protein
MNPRKTTLPRRDILRFWLPLEATWVMMALEAPLLSAIIARLAEPKFNLAAYGVAFSLTLFVEAPILMIISASTALVKDRDSFLKLRRFTLILIGCLTSFMIFLLLPPVFYLVAERVIGLPGPIVRLTHLACLLFIPLPWAIGYRRFYQGILIRNNRTRFVAFGTAIRLITIILSSLLYFFLPLEGAMVGALALSTSVIVEAFSSRFMANNLVQALLKPPGEGKGRAPNPLSYREIVQFYLPLAMTSILALGTQPLVTFFVAHGRMAIDSLAVLPVIFGLVFIFMSFGLSFHEASIALLGERQRHYAALRDFAFGLGTITVGLLGLIGFTPLATLWFHKVSGLPLVLTHFSLLPLKILTPLPGIWVWLTFQRSVLVNARRTRPITWATGLELLLIVFTLLISIRYFDLVGVVAASLALVIGRVGANLYLLNPFLKALKKNR